MTEQLGLDLGEDKFIDLLHHFITQEATKERNAFQAGHAYDMDPMLQILVAYLKSTPQREAILKR